MIALAVTTGVSPREWRREGVRAIATAIDIIDERHRKTRQANENR